MVSIANIFDMSANSWDKTEEKRFEKIHLMCISNTKKYLKSNDIVLDFGCATGTKAIEFSSNVKTLKAIDISAKMIDTARRKARDHNIDNVEFIQTSITDSNFKEQSFDVILAFAVLHLLEDHITIIERISNLLKPGGLFISTTPCLAERMDFKDKIIFSFVRFLSAVRMFPFIKQFSFSELESEINFGNLQIIDSEKIYNELSSYFIVAKKNNGEI